MGAWDQEDPSHQWTNVSIGVSFISPTSHSHGNQSGPPASRSMGGTWYRVWLLSL
ncbi:hypothetical protein Airi01_047910 [Actinoallomurus iriomotensis]|uniref:Uncharacterized protein n=1 Tax=Actinoallomurus iriomotensis TaxID=478107 RepID=A0A9W6VR26_9ACTN|nr:hypothetical protein Airi01_047910 [Actinoallomurus iriomotensis]